MTRVRRWWANSAMGSSLSSSEFDLVIISSGSEGELRAGWDGLNFQYFSTYSWITIEIIVWVSETKINRIIQHVQPLFVPHLASFWHLGYRFPALVLAPVPHPNASWCIQVWNTDVILRCSIRYKLIFKMKWTYQGQGEKPASNQTYYNISAVFQAHRSMHHDTPHIFQVWFFSPMRFEVTQRQWLHNIH